MQAKRTAPRSRHAVPGPAPSPTAAVLRCLPPARALQAPLPPPRPAARRAAPRPRAHWFVQDFNGSSKSLWHDRHRGRWTNRHRPQSNTACTIQQDYWAAAQHRLDCHVWQLQPWSWPSADTQGTARGILATTIWQLYDRYQASTTSPTAGTSFYELASLLVGATTERQSLRAAHTKLSSELDHLATLGDIPDQDATPYQAQLAYITTAIQHGTDQLVDLVATAERQANGERHATLYGRLTTLAELPELLECPSSMCLAALAELADHLD